MRTVPEIIFESDGYSEICIVVSQFDALFWYYSFSNRLAWIIIELTNAIIKVLLHIGIGLIKSVLILSENIS